MKILLLAGSGKSTRYLFNGLNPEFKIGKVIIEKPISRRVLIKRRIRRIGLTKVIGQVAFMIIVPSILRFFSKDRISELEEMYSLSTKEISKDKLTCVSSVNDDDCLKKIKNYNPDLILVNGTRILNSRIIESVKVPFINIHVGITPTYRGVHGGYWALANNDIENCGVTIHFIDKGIDTGEIISQEKININSLDNFITYPIHQYGIGITLFREALKKIKNGEEIIRIKATGKSNLFYHPTVTGYIYNRVFKKIK